MARCPEAPGAEEPRTTTTACPIEAEARRKRETTAQTNQRVTARATTSHSAASISEPRLDAAGWRAAIRPTSRSTRRSKLQILPATRGPIVRPPNTSLERTKAPDAMAPDWRSSFGGRGDPHRSEGERTLPSPAVRVPAVEWIRALGQRPAKRTSAIAHRRRDSSRFLLPRSVAGSSPTRHCPSRLTPLRSNAIERWGTACTRDRPEACLPGLWFPIRSCGMAPAVERADNSPVRHSSPERSWKKYYSRPI